MNAVKERPAIPTKIALKVTRIVNTVGFLVKEIVIHISEAMTEDVNSVSIYFLKRSIYGPANTWAKVGKAFVENCRTPWVIPEGVKDAR